MSADPGRAGRLGVLVRLDRAAEAIADGGTLTAAGVPVRLVKPAWARFAFPGEIAPGVTKAAG
ncbi:MAG: hypothetical protein WBD71_11625 [Xanthobacteraceae bacterium]